MLFCACCMPDLWLQTRPMVAAVQPRDKMGFHGARHKLRRQPRGSCGTHELPKLHFPRGLEHRSALSNYTESSLSLSFRETKGFEKMQLSTSLSAGASSGGGRCRGAGFGTLGQHPSPSQLPSKRNVLSSFRFYQKTKKKKQNRKKKKKEKERLCNSCEGLSVCIVLSCSARIKYALKFRVGIIDCI